ncbi:SUKH-4 family immunity protein [Streptomyces sp. NPDC004082]|uniref:SUKH-4 family immunity protein n=1 Tax=unclassified Streptomyces TaxID=2593676 RepID=UPI0033A74728
MSFAVTPDELLETFGPTGVVYFPRHDAPGNELAPRTADFLSRVGLPDNDCFKSSAGIGINGALRQPSRTVAIAAATVPLALAVLAWPAPPAGWPPDATRCTSWSPTPRGRTVRTGRPSRLGRGR